MRNLKIPLPRTAAEFAAITKWYFGKELHLRRLYVSESAGSYEIEEDYNAYNGKGWHFSENCIHGYDYSGRLWATVFGHLTCGGIARASYGQFNFKGHRQHARLKALMNNLRGDSANYARPSFVRLASQSRGKRDWRDSR